ncbi:NAC transcription factor 25-like [Rosa sericea]
MPSVLVGFRFHPTDEELISYFLYKKNNVGTMAEVPSMATYNFNKIMPELDLYGDVEPWQIWETYGGLELYDQDMFFFTQHKTVNPDGLRIHRKVGSGGTWSEGEPGKLILDPKHKQKPIGQKRKFRYENKGSDHNGSWYLEEYSLLSTNSANYVLCRLRQNIKTGKKRKEILLCQESSALPMTYIPVGFRFHPTDQELISYFLYNKLTEEASLYIYKNIVREFDLFGTTEPWEIWDMYGGHELCNQNLFFFTKLKKASLNGSRILRKIGSSGTWSETDASKLIKDEELQKHIGRRRKLRYESKCSKHHGHWYLDEYSLLDSKSDYVICRLRKNDKSPLPLSEWNGNKRKYSALCQESKEKQKLLSVTKKKLMRKQSNVMMNITNNKNNNLSDPIDQTKRMEPCTKFKLFGVEIGSNF